MESICTMIALYDIKNKCARTDTVFLPISEVCDNTVYLCVMPVEDKKRSKYFQNNVISV